MIEAKNLVKRYGDFTAVDGVSLSIDQGEIYGFLGPNGAGKTTTINMLLGTLAPTEGTVTLFGKPLHPDDPETKLRIGVVPEKHPSGFWPWLTAGEYLEFFADLFSVSNSAKKIDELLERVELIRYRAKKVREFSRGMLQKLSILRALLKGPDILFLDEPISGLDPIGIKQVRDLILDENKKGRTIFISSHILSEVEKICGRAAVILKGRIQREEEMALLVTSLSADREIYIEAEDIPHGFSGKIAKLPFVLECDVCGNRIKVTIDKTGDFRKDLSKYIYDMGVVPLSIQEKSASLEDAFIQITQETLEKVSSEENSE